MSNITQVVNVGKNLTILKRGVIVSGLDQVLSSRGPFTLFAPSDVAFKKLDQHVIDDLMNPDNIVQLTDLLRYHVVAGKIDIKELKDGNKLTTVSGKELQVMVKEGVTNIEGSVIKNDNINASNGVIYSLDTVMTQN